MGNAEEGFIHIPFPRALGSLGTGLHTWNHLLCSGSYIAPSETQLGDGGEREKTHISSDRSTLEIIVWK